MKLNDGITFYVSCCTKDGGIARLRTDREGMIRYESITPCDRPMYFCITENEMDVLLRAPYDNSNNGGHIRYKLSENGELTKISELICTDGIVPCHLTRSGEDIYTVNYLSGNLVMLGKKTVTHTGKSIHPSRQEAPHTHYVDQTPDGNLLVTDLGTDEIYIYSKSLEEISKVKTTPGFGPRHAVFSEDGNYAFVCCELASKLIVYRYHGNALTYLTHADLLPPDFDKESTAAAIRRDGNHIFVSNRGHDSITEFTWDGKTLRFIRCIPTYGQGPRDFWVLDDAFLSTNEQSNTLTVISRTTGKLLFTVPLPSPISIVPYLPLA